MKNYFAKNLKTYFKLTMPKIYMENKYSIILLKDIIKLHKNRICNF
ncbi:MAG: hypothetical protein GY830_04035 [Bacteroidetes bacterium]|nr:hypothetical protein [Bacteroidota bacterium]